MEITAGLDSILTQKEDENIETEIAKASEFMEEIDICLTTLEDVTRVETEEQVPPTQGIPAQQVGTSTVHENNNSKVRLSCIFLHSMVDSRNGQHFGTVLNQQFIQINRLRRWKRFSIYERLSRARLPPLSTV